jgi:putative DNA primase/helicase
MTAASLRRPNNGTLTPIYSTPRRESEMTVDLRTGERYAPRPEDYMTKCAAASPGGECPLWLAFLHRVTKGDVKLQNYLQRVAGYCLTGHTSEHAVFFLFGTGANGKSVFVNTLAGMMGDYAITAPMEVFIESHSDRHPTELAMLRGARLVVASETQSGRNWNEQRIKTLTGGDRISARFMRGDFFEFTPQFKLMISGNHKPSLRNIDEAIRRRLHLIPFVVTIPVGERDPDLAEKLKAEWGGILQWAIDGTLEWRRVGLSPPDVVVRATEEYLEAEDDIRSWISDCCTEESGARTSSSALYASWKDWAERVGRRGGPGSQKSFSESLTGHGFEKTKTRTGIVFSGLQIGRDTSE